MGDHLHEAEKCRDWAEIQRALPEIRRDRAVLIGAGCKPKEDSSWHQSASGLGTWRGQQK